MYEHRVENRPRALLLEHTRPAGNIRVSDVCCEKASRARAGVLINPSEFRVSAALTMRHGCRRKLRSMNR